ncbi:hypothetical protein SPE_1139 [Spiroplasma eriocheiris CCTCC M 207170]|nr:hypothetical protein SPE_1139 [Spiroplasma eriocheiris CCTCC M 207170]
MFFLLWNSVVIFILTIWQFMINNNYYKKGGDVMSKTISNSRKKLCENWILNNNGFDKTILGYNFPVKFLVR